MMASPVNRSTHVHVHGDFRQPGKLVQSGTPASLPALAQDRPPDRLALAQWLVSDRHPMTARVTMNRLWQELFGRGIVATSENFGVRGDLPTHPELLDWLAVELVRRGWSIKSMLRCIVLSETYRQSSTLRPELVTRDPSNKLVARQTRLRLSGEEIRDSALAASGLLNRVVGGPSVKPPQPESVSKEAYHNTWEASVGGDRYRRGLYTFLQRTSPYSQLVTFDLPDTSRSCTRRAHSNTPLQALNLLNDPVFVEAAQSLAATDEREAAGDDSHKLSHAFMLVLGRKPTQAETRRMNEYLKRQREIFADEPKAAEELADAAPSEVDAAWVGAASVLLNLDEFIHRE